MILERNNLPKLSWRESLAQVIPANRVTWHVPMSRLTTFRIGGPVDALVQPETPEEVACVVRFLEEHGVPWMVLGLGSNLLVRDGGIRGAIIRLGSAFNQFKVLPDGQVHAGAAVSLSKLARQLGEAGWTGMEFAVGIPGSLGGAVFMNAGAYDGEMGQVVELVEAYWPEKGLVTLCKEELCFGYRQSCLQSEKRIALSAHLRLNSGDKVMIREKVAEFTKRRQSKQPLEMPSAGSVFKRPPGLYAGTLIEQAGLKGTMVGGAQVSVKHANFIVNTGNATADDVLKLIEVVRQRVHEHAGVWLEPEVRVVGEDTTIFREAGEGSER
jgi:UDP-N-acetylmuramate dehydrogenase